MLRQINMPQSDTPRVMGAVVVLVLLCPASPAVAQSDPLRAQPDADAAEAQPVAQAPNLDSSHAIEAHRIVTNWLKLGHTETSVGTAGTLPIANLAGVHLTLRSKGMVLGTGQAWIDQPLAAAAPRANRASQTTDLVPLLRQAIRQARESVQQTLADDRVRPEPRLAYLWPGETIDRNVPAVSTMADKLLLSVELAAMPQRMGRPNPKDSRWMLNAMAPGYHGLLLANVDESRTESQGDAQTMAVRWPAMSLAANLTPSRLLVQLLDELGYARHAQAVVSTPRGPQLYRFATVHAARPSLDMPVMPLVRGAVDRKAMTAQDLATLRHELAEHLMQRFVGRAQMLGTYHPLAHRFDPQYADIESSALAVYALARHARQLRLANANQRQIKQYGDVILLMLKNFENHFAAQPNDRTPAAAALCLLAMIDCPVVGVSRTYRDQLADSLMSLHQPGKGFVDQPGDKGEALNQTHTALVVAAISAYHSLTRNQKSGEIARDAMDTIWQQTKANPSITALPWLVLADEKQLAAAADAAQSAQQADAEHHKALARLIDLLGQQQIIEQPVLGPNDVMGGFELHKAPAGAPPNPDWRTAQLLAFLAVCMREPAIQEDLPIGGRLTALLAAKFLARLIVDEPGTFYMPHPETAIGGVRISPWDNRLGLAPTAMTLLAMTELGQTLAAE